MNTKLVGATGKGCQFHLQGFREMRIVDGCHADDAIAGYGFFPTGKICHLSGTIERIGTERNGQDALMRQSRCEKRGRDEGRITLSHGAFFELFFYRITYK